MLDTAVEERAAARVSQVDRGAVEEAGCLAAAARDVGACDAPVGVHERLRLEPHAASPCAQQSFYWHGKNAIQMTGWAESGSVTFNALSRIGII